MSGQPNAPARRSHRAAPMSGPLASVDLVVCVLLALFAAFAYAALPAGNGLRIVLVLPVLFFVPGYLLIQALMPRRPLVARAVHGVVAIGVSPGLVGLLALMTSIVPGGFQPAAIVTVVTLSCVIFASLAYYRRTTAPAKPKVEAAPAHQPVA